MICFPIFSLSPPVFLTVPDNNYGKKTWSKYSKCKKHRGAGRSKKAHYWLKGSLVDEVANGIVKTTAVIWKKGINKSIYHERSYLLNMTTLFPIK